MPLIKRYSNRKLYDTEARQYVKLDDIGEMVRRGEDVRVVDHATGADLTTGILLQVVLEQERSIGGILPNSILRRIIRSGDRAFEHLRVALGAFANPTEFVEDEIRSRLEILMGQGQLNAEEGKRMADLLLSAAFQRGQSQEGTSKPTEELADEQDINRLTAELARLEKELNNLLQND